MASAKQIVVEIAFMVSISLTLFSNCDALLQQGKWQLNFSPKRQSNGTAIYDVNGVTKTLYKDSKISIKVECDDDDREIEVLWVVQETICAELYDAEIQNKDFLSSVILSPMGQGFYKVKSFLRPPSTILKCGENHLEPFDDWKSGIGNSLDTETKSEDSKLPNTPTTKIKNNKKSDPARKKRADDGSSDGQQNVTMQGTNLPASSPNSGDKYVVTKTPSDGVFILVIQVISKSEKTVTVSVDIKGPKGYLSAIDWPLLPFYISMCVVYFIFGVIWLVLSMCNWKDLLRIQFWIIGVIILGMLEKAVFLAEHEAVNTSGNSVRGAIVVAEVVSCAKRTLARMLVVIVSLGYGIVKPRLGENLHRLVIIGGLYFLFSVIEGCMRELKIKTDTSNQLLLATIPLALIDAAICWWVFTSLVQVTRTLRLRRNVVKLNLYRHFTNTLIFAVLASVIYMAWSIKMHKYVECLSDWKELWVDEAFWHLLFSIILFVIMILWRPTNNNQRYAYSPLLDQVDEEDEAQVNDAFDGMKQRSMGKSTTTPKQRDSAAKAEEDLKWIEENIPPSVADTALPSLLDSDEEIMTTRFEMSKME